jgi:signal transduction histidine kinase
MAAMRQRMLRVGGVLVVETIPGEGTAVCASVPLAVSASQECG